MLVLGIPHTTLRRQVGCPESLVAIQMPGSRGASGLLSHLLRNYWREYRQGLDDTHSGRIAVALVDLIGAAYAGLPQAIASRQPTGVVANATARWRDTCAESKYLYRFIQWL